MTESSMHDARDAEHQRLFEGGEHPALVETHNGVTIRRCQAKVRCGEPVGVAHEVAIRRRPVDLTESADRKLERDANVFVPELLMPEPAAQERSA